MQESYEAERRTIADAHSGLDDFKNQWGLTPIRADVAYAHVQLKHDIDRDVGSGQTVGLIDTGIDAGHPVFAGKTISEHFFGRAQDETGREFSHGTAVASIIAARQNAMFDYPGASPAQGVAWGADIAMFAVPTGADDGVYEPFALTAETGVDDQWATWFNHLIDWSSGGRTLDFVNVSVGIHGIIDQYSEEDIRAGFGDYIEALAQADTIDKTVFIWAAGNAHGDPCYAADFANNPNLCINETVNAKSVDMQAGLPARIAELCGHLISVVAVAPDSDGDGGHEITDFSNRCGIAKDWCIAAPGEDVRVAYFGPYEGTAGARRNATGGGTSFAAPMVTGALVVMKDYFRDELYNTDLVTRLLATANKGGIYADADVYGQGLLDLAAAISPAGTPSIALDQRVEGADVSLAVSRLGLGDALGDGLTRALAGKEVAAFDELGAPFWYSLGSLAEAAEGPSAHVRLRGFMSPARTSDEVGSWRPVLGLVEKDDSAAALPLWLGLMDTPRLGDYGGHLSLAGKALGLSTAGQAGLVAAAFSTEGLDGQAPVSGAMIAWRPEGAPLGLRGGWVGEREAILGTKAAGAFGRMAAASAFAGIEASERIGAWHLGANAEIGTVNASVRGGLIGDISPLTTSAFALHATRSWADTGALTLSLAQPLRVEAGKARLSVPIGRTKDGYVRRSSVTADLVPTGRQIEVAAQWRQALATGGELRLGAAWTRHPGHAASANPDLTLLAGWRHTF
ncbi:MAG: S8 family serine peptidase [Rhodospirillales bacterium]|nr:S8 family serine peptidase [Rhodospirillales bacterium]